MAARERTVAAQDDGAARAGLPRRASATDKEGPHDSERNRGGATVGGVARRRWFLRRDHRLYRVRHTRAHLVEPSIEAIVAATGVSDEHGGARPRHGRLRRRYGVAAIMGGATGFSRVHRT